MIELAKNVWALLIAAMFFGVWTLPILIVMIAASFYIRHRWPGRFDKYL